MKKILVFGHIGPANFLLCYLLSFFWEIKTFRFHNRRFKKFLKRISIFQYSNYNYSEEVTKYAMHESAKTWAKKIQLIDHDNVFTITIDDKKMNVSRQVKKSFSELFPQYHLFQKFSEANEVFVHGIGIYYINKYTDYPVKQKQDGVLKLIDSLNILLEHIGKQFYYLIQHLFRIMVCVKTINSGKNCQWNNTKIIWDAVSGPSEMSLDKDQQSCLWILEGTDLKKEEVLFILPRIFIKKLASKLNALQINYAYSPIELIKYLPLKQQLKIIQFSFLTIVDIFKGFFKLSIGNQINTHKLGMLCWNFLVPELEIETYVDTLSTVLLGNYDVVMLNQLSVNTVIYCYSANSFPHTIKEKIDPFHISYSNILYQYITVWHQGYAKEMNNTYDKNMKKKITGPLITGREIFKDEELDFYRKKYLGASNQKLFYISVFDIPSHVSKSDTGLLTIPPPAYTEEYYTAFIRDIDRLMDAVPDIVILYKPKKDFSLLINPVPQAFSEIIEKNKEHPRWITLDSKINPWLLILLTNLVISIPFTSVALAALNKKKAFLYHNPNHQIKHHFYNELNNHITHSYENLVNQVKRIKQEGMDFTECQQSSYYVPEPQGGYTQGFVDFLRDPNQEYTPTSTFINS